MVYGFPGLELTNTVLNHSLIVGPNLPRESSAQAVAG